jgi:DNA-binding response OmpR family regulator
MSLNQSQSPLQIVVYSSDLTVRAQVVSALGRQVASDLPEHRIIEIATGDALRLYVDQKKPVDLFILDGEATPEGGMGISRELKDEVFNCPPVLLIAARLEDSWLATWSRADDVMLHPVDPFTCADKAAALLRSRTVAIH